MRDIQHWLIDFDDTLAVADATRALQQIFPAFIKRHELPLEPEAFQAAIHAGQREANDNPDAQALVRRLFQQMDWPLTLVDAFLQELQRTHAPQLFDDARPFLDRLQATEKPIYMLSNNPQSEETARALGIDHYFVAMLTPHHFDGHPRKPQQALWQAIQTAYPQMNARETAIIGDDPWSEGLFADACGLQCWIVDRRGSYADLRADKPYQWVQSLHEITF